MNLFAFAETVSVPTVMSAKTPITAVRNGVIKEPLPAHQAREKTYKEAKEGGRGIYL